MPWSSGYGRRLLLKRLWVRILAPDPGWTFFTLLCCKNCTVYLYEKSDNKRKERLRRVQSCILKQATAEAEAVLASLKSKFDLSRSLLGKSIKKESEAFDVKNWVVRPSQSIFLRLLFLIRLRGKRRRIPTSQTVWPDWAIFESSWQQ